MLAALLLAPFLGLIPAFIASSKGRSFVLWWFYGTMLFIVAFLHSLFISADQATLDQQSRASGMVKCWSCAEYIRPDAFVCRYCGNQTSSGVARQTAVSASSIIAERSKLTQCHGCGKWNTFRVCECGVDKLDESTVPST